MEGRTAPVMERRKHPRTSRRLYLTLDDVPGQNIAFTGDVSANGILIETSAPLAPGRSVGIKLTLPTGSTIHLIGHVQWAARGQAATRGHFNQYGAGVSLQKAPEEFHRFIASIAETDSPQTAIEAQRASPPHVKANGATQSVIAAHDAMKRQNHYDVLGVPPDATSDEIKWAYYTLAKTYHPDRSREDGCEQLRSQLETLFHRIAEAFVILSSQRRRERYDRALG